MIFLGLGFVIVLVSTSWIACRRLRNFFDDSEYREQAYLRWLAERE